MLKWKRNLFFSSKGDDFVHFDVERLGRHLVNELEIEADADASHVQMLAEETVVIATSAPKAVALAVESHARNHNEVEITLVRLVLGLKNVEVANGKIGVAGIFHRDDVVAHHGGKDDLLVEMPFFEEPLGLHLIGQSTVKHYLMCFYEVGMAFQFGHNCCRLPCQLLFRMLLFQCLDVGTQFFFVHTIENFAQK